MTSKVKYCCILKDSKGAKQCIRKTKNDTTKVRKIDWKQKLKELRALQSTLFGDVN